MAGIWRTAARVLADVLITAGLLAMLFAAYLVVWTNVTADRAAAAAATAVAARLDADEAIIPEPGAAFGLIYIPRLQQDVWGEPILQGVGAAQLSRGFGHYPQTALPGEPGNAALAAHRATNGEPLRYVDRLHKGDRVLIRTDTGWHTYRLVADRIVDPADTWVISDEMTRRLDAEEILTLTTCHPRWGSTERWVWWGVLEGTSAQRPELG